MERKLTEEQREHLEELIKVSEIVIRGAQTRIEELRSKKKTYEVMLRDYDQPSLLLPESANPDVDSMLNDVIENGNMLEDEALKDMMNTNRIVFFGVVFHVDGRMKFASGSGLSDLSDALEAIDIVRKEDGIWLHINGGMKSVCLNITNHAAVAGEVMEEWHKMRKAALSKLGGK